jgi:predicted phage tail protein
MIKLTIYGRLRKFVGQSSFEIKAKSPKEAFSFLVNNFQGVREHIKDQEYCIMAGDIRITEDLLDLQTESEIKIIPVVHGELFFLAAGALFTAWGAGATILGITIGAALQSTFLAIGINMLIGGVTDMLTPDPKPFGADRQEDPQDPNYNFTGLLNNSKQGVPINIIYGETLVGSTVVSSSIDTFQVVNEED